MTEAANAPFAALANLLADARVVLDEANDRAKEAQAAYDKVQAELFDALENAGLQQIRTERGLFRLNDLAWASVTDETAARAWADEHAPELITLNRQRLAVVVRNAIKGEDGATMPPGVEATFSRKITWRRS